MKIVKEIILWLLLLVFMFLGVTLILKIFDILLKLGYENIWYSGFRVGFAAWTGVIANEIYHYFKNKKK